MFEHAFKILMNMFLTLLMLFNLQIITAQFHLTAPHTIATRCLYINNIAKHIEIPDLRRRKEMCLINTNLATNQ